ncbi:putative ABC transport system permease protein [Nitrosospira sp. Nsp11]|uniref:FtsX-like permease family protein n=1 Tax=Nitrosospira sp. Nsp11 TaxID=1855338 RepID=UPI000914338F|nr:FtsX-like permease family protein [Nitrosospira sp. Nsp11]SHL84785.1 putative ABC transport system permease protein [Nitrosospira sp. Nsp11]
MAKLTHSGALSRWLLWGEWRAHRSQAVVAVIAIAIGVALGFAIHLINAAAFNEFSAAARSISGQSDLQVRGAQATFDESLFPVLAERDGVELANPVLELDVAIPGNRDENKGATLKILGLDIFRASIMTPDLIGIPAEDKLFDILADDAIFLSPAAMEWLDVKLGDPLQLRVGTQAITLRVAGGLTRARAGQRIGVMDIGAAQWRFQRIGQLSRIELKLVRGMGHAAFKAALEQELKLRGQFLVTEPADQETRVANMSRAYRVNLNMLAMVALFTGTFLVFSTQALSVVRRRHQFALLRVLGLTRRQLLGQILLEGGALGIVGSLLGLALGYVAAATALHVFGGDLGSGFFSGVKPSVHFDPVVATFLFFLGLSTTLLGSAAPAWEAATAKPAPALKSGSEDAALSKLATSWPALVCLVLAGVLTQLPPIFELPIFGYLAVVLLLIGGIALMPRLSALIFSAVFSAISKRTSRAMPLLALARLANAPNQASIALGGVLASFTLMVSMAIMVASFRVSVDDWLKHILPAQLYVKTATSGDTRGLTPGEKEALAALPGISRADFFRSSQLTLDPRRPSIALMARPIDAADPGNTLPITGEAIAPALLPKDAIPIWVSEAMVDLYGYTPGTRVTLPIATPSPVFVVAGVWRDYGRQFGAIQMRLADYQALSGDNKVNDAALWLQEGVTPEQAIASMKRLPFGDALEFSEPGEIYASSLNFFDRSFAVTYLLEMVAIVIGLLGVAASFSAQALARGKEFGMLRHIGATRRQILSMLAVEGGLVTVLGIVLGFALGGCISLILVFIVNPQSFHWTMELSLPWRGLLAVAFVLTASAALTALLSGRHAVSGNAIRAVREDW